jgi:quinoprotein glucose dehydrogenase
MQYLSRHLALGALLSGAVAACTVLPGTDSSPGAAASTEWPTYGHDPGGMRFSPLKQITPQNVSRLEPAWTYSMRKAAPAAAPGREQAAQAAAEGAAPAGPPGRLGGSEVTPLVVNGTMYLSTPYRQVVALDPETGQERWAYDVPGPGQPSLRGVEYWPGTATEAPRILFGTRDGRLIALDATNGKPASTFGSGGIVDLKTPEVMRGSTSN